MAKEITPVTADDSDSSKSAELQVQSENTNSDAAERGVSTENTKKDGKKKQIEVREGDADKSNLPPVIINTHPSITDSTANFIMDADGKLSALGAVNKNFVLRYLKKKTEGLTHRQVMIVIIFAFVEFFAATVISIQAPFFPGVVSAMHCK